MKSFILAMLLATSLHAQHAKVIALTTHETEEAIRLDNEAKRAIAAQEAFTASIAEKYAKGSQGWEYGVDFSEGFKFIVPAMPPKFINSSPFCGSCLTVNPVNFTVGQ